MIHSIGFYFLSRHFAQKRNAYAWVMPKADSLENQNEYCKYQSGGYNRRYAAISLRLIALVLPLLFSVS